MILLGHDGGPGPTSLEQALGDLTLFVVTLSVAVALGAYGLRSLWQRARRDDAARREMVGWAALAGALVVSLGVAMARGTVADVTLAPVVGEEEYHRHSREHGGLVSMYRDYHVEVSRFAGDEYRVYLTDAYRREIAPDLFSGTLTVAAGGAPERTETLRLGPGGPYLFACFKPAQGPVEAKVDLQMPGQRVALKFVFDGKAPVHEPDQWCQFRTWDYGY